MNIDFDYIKEYARQTGQKITDLLVGFRGKCGANLMAVRFDLLTALLEQKKWRNEQQNL